MIKSKNISVNVSLNGSNSELRNALENAVPVAARQVSEIAGNFKGKNELDTCRKIYDHLMSFRYVKDGVHQKIQLPSRLLNTKAGDCKSYSLLTAALLQNLKIPYRFVYASYDKNNSVPGHVYVQTNSGIIIDAVWGMNGGKFNTEKKPEYKYYKDMQISYLAGVDAPGLGAQKRKPKTIAGKVLNVGKKVVTTPAKVVVKGAKQVGLAPGRTLFLIAMRENFNGLANGMSKVSSSKIAELWKKIGGNPEELQKAISVGSSKAPKKSDLLKRLSPC